jgi:hypothetical protein
MRTSFPTLAGLLLLLALGGCGGADEAAGDEAAATDVAADATDPDAYDDTGADASADAGDELPPPLALAPSHLDPLVRGITAENARLEKAVQRLKAAETDRETLAALSEIDADTLDGLGAEAAGLAAHEYRFLRDALYEHLGAVDTRNALQAQYADADTTGMDEATAAEARRMAAEVMAAVPDPYADLDPALADALRQRHAELASLRSNHIGLLFKAAEG